MFISLIIAILLLLLVFYFYQKSKPKKLDSFPKNWISILEEHVEFYRELSPEKQLLFQDKILDFLSRIYINGIQTEVSETDQLLVASSAVIPIFNFKQFHYTNLDTVLLYPDAFNADLKFAEDSKDRNIGGLVGTARFEKQMILSKKSLYAGFHPNTQGLNTGIHEFVHLIDKMDGETDGVPSILMKHPYTLPWLDLIRKEIQKIEDNKSDLRKYGATNPAEFFAVAAEYFFEKPEKMQEDHPELLEMMQSFFE